MMRELCYGQRALVFELVNGLIVCTRREKKRLTLFKTKEKFNWQRKRKENRQIKGWASI